ncbi:hypothetical protein FHL15_007289 [Xylaria flabelliformis]|uniref:Major facilitator superfamily (MFS) profile domain-containing protein n=1 Tax=Xylaria flabelliformis TaxID=2512241 RepID=A0A553HUV6_9PEZI|nr:hypothetical protein FHL15_007289 [Xylaria flabelliformis]
MDAEYMAASNAAKECVWVRWFINDLKILYLHVDHVDMHIDNDSALKLTKNPELHKKAKHIEVAYHFLVFQLLLGGEYPNSALRGYCFGVATALNFLGNFLGTLTAPYFINPAALNWGPKYGYIWFASNLVVVIFAYLFLPETRDRTLEEIHEMFENKVPARKFKTYICTGVEAYAAAAGKESVQHREISTIERVTHSEVDLRKQ